MRRALLVSAVMLVGCPSPPPDVVSGSSAATDEDSTNEGSTDEASSEGGSATELFCYRTKRPWFSPVCDCYPTEQDRSATYWEVVTSCGGTQDLMCFASIRTSGDVDNCECYQRGCFEDDSGYCECNNGAIISALDPDSAHEVAECPPQEGGSCCVDNDFIHCWCDGSCEGPNVDTIDHCDDTVPHAASENDSRTPVTSCHDLQ